MRWINNPHETRIMYQIPQWMIEAVRKLKQIDKMDERKIAHLLHTGVVQVRAANWWARFGGRYFMTESDT